MDTSPFDESLDVAQPPGDPALEPWLSAVSDEDPCGPDLEYDNDFLALTQAAAGKPETQFAPAEPPELPPGVCSRFHGLREVPWISLYDWKSEALSGRLVLPRMTAPASR